MRDELRKYLSKRLRVQALVQQFGEREGINGFPIRTVLIADARHSATKELITDHLWFPCGKWSETLRVGDLFEFESTVSTYVKGRSDGLNNPSPNNPLEIDYRLQPPFKVFILGRKNNG